MNQDSKSADVLFFACIALVATLLFMLSVKIVRSWTSIVQYFVSLFNQLIDYMKQDYIMHIPIVLALALFVFMFIFFILRECFYLIRAIRSQVEEEVN